MKNTIFSLKIAMLFSASLHAQQTEDKIYHYSSMDAMRNGGYTGNVTLGGAIKVSEKDITGIATFYENKTTV